MVLKTLACNNKSKIKQKIDLLYIILEKRKAIKKFLKKDKTNIIYIKEI